VHPCRLHVIGASGSGTTTLARAVASAWSVPHADADDYFWVPTDPPFTTKRPEVERMSLMREVFAPRSAWVLSGSMVGWGQEITRLIDAVVFVTLDPATRMERLRRREEVRRTVQAVDQASLDAFLEWARQYDDPTFEGRSRAGHEAWLESLGRPVLRLDSAATPEELRDAVLSHDFTQ
jgi:shikimate kinase